jgi:succinate-semialdehyde dehydrogenase/glutarate-semialdehyde dehydrogenase
LKNKKDMITSINPANNTPIKSYKLQTSKEVSKAIENAHETFRRYKKWRLSERAEAMRKAANLLESRSRNLAQIITMEMGKTLASAQAEVKKCAWVCRYYADHAANFWRTKK